MQEMIKRIVDMDKKAREITAAAEQEKIDSEKDVVEKAEQLREDYLSSARRRIQINKTLENDVLEQKWAKTKAHYDIQIENMKNIYAENGDRWVDSIYQRVIKEE